MAITLRSYQWELFNLPTFIKALVGGFGSGKTYSAAARAIMFASENPGIEGGIVSPSLPMARKSVIPAIRKMCDEHNIKYHFNKSHHYFDLMDARVWIMSGHDPDSLKGPNFGWGAIDEPFIQKEEVYYFMLSRLRVKESTMLELLLTGTPEQLNWGYKILEGDRKKDASYIRVSSRANLPEKTLQVLLRTYTKQMAKAFIDGEFVPINIKSAYYSFSDEAVAKLEYNPNIPLVLSCDFNKAPMCWNIMQEPQSYIDIFGKRYSYRDTHVLDEIHVEGTDTYECIGEFCQRYRHHKGMILVSGDYSGNSTSDTAATMTNYEAILHKCAREFGADKVELQIMPNPQHKARLNITNREFLNAAGERHLFIDPKCKHTIDHYRFASIKEGTQSLDKKKLDPHHADAVDYRVWYKANQLLQDVA